MNLIERLGGYANAKNELKIYGILETEYIQGIFKEDLVNSLLEYRRERKFYEVGDLVVCEHFEMDGVKHLLTVEIVRGHYLQLSDGVSCTTHLVRHATDAEIEAGRRL